ncbi:MAG TPA: polysaccharide pyruvyl transferase family protein [Hyphomicrobiaceae bacterium]|nr:polysaccharide pyruvyl transferase family protein [Hyphomicrobiaceae bacterium]
MAISRHTFDKPPGQDVKKAILINTTFQIGHHGCTLVDRQLDRLANECGLHIIAKLPLDSDWSALTPPQFDVVLVNGEGGLHHDSKAAKLIARVPQWAKAMKRPAHLLNSVYEANSAAIAAGVAQYNSIFVRDEFSRQALAAQGISSSVVADLALTWEPPALGGAGREIVVTDSTVRETNEALHALSRALHARFLPLMARPPRPTEPVHHPSRWRRYVGKRFAARFAPPGLWRDRWRGLIPEFDDFVRYLTNHAGLIVAGRFHAVCLALDLEIPFLAVSSNTRKVEGVLAAAGLQSRLVNNPAELSTVLLHKPVHAKAFTGPEIEKIRAFRHQVMLNARHMLESIAG